MLRLSTGFGTIAALAVILTGAASPAERIVGGTPIQIESAPWAAFVLDDAGPRHNQCGGTVIDSLHVVTAAHCVYGLGSGVLATPDQVSVRAGLSIVGPPGAGTGIEQDRDVVAIRVHPSFVYDDTGALGDIAVLTLSQPLDLTGAAVEAASLPAANALYPTGAQLTMAGYGEETPGAEPTEQLESMTVTVDPQGSCGQASEFARMMYFENGSEFCSISPTSVGCGGDSGSGLVAGGTAHPVLAGVYSTGTPKCGPGTPELSISVWTPENRSFILGNDQPPLAPRPSYPGTEWTLQWDRFPQPPAVGDELTCSTTGWPTAVRVGYTFAIANGKVLQSGSRNTYRTTAASVGKSVACTITARNAGGATVETTKPTAPIEPAGPAAGSADVLASKYLVQLSENHGRNVTVRCVSREQLANLGSGSVAAMGFARAHAKLIYLDANSACAPLARITPSASKIGNGALQALLVVAREYGYSVGLTRGPAVECYAVKTTWKWLRRALSLDSAAHAAARAYLLDNQRQPASLALPSTCALS